MKYNVYVSVCGRVCVSVDAADDRTRGLLKKAFEAWNKREA